MLTVRREQRSGPLCFLLNVFAIHLPMHSRQTSSESSRFPEETSSTEPWGWTRCGANDIDVSMEGALSNVSFARDAALLDAADSWVFRLPSANRRLVLGFRWESPGGRRHGCERPQRGGCVSEGHEVQSVKSMETELRTNSRAPDDTKPHQPGGRDARSWEARGMIATQTISRLSARWNTLAALGCRSTLCVTRFF
jgi:hypothetical protein